MHITAWHILTDFWWELILSKWWIWHILKQYLRLYNLSFSRNVFSSVIGHQFQAQFLDHHVCCNPHLASLYLYFTLQLFSLLHCQSDRYSRHVQLHLQRDSHHAKIKKQIIRRPSREGRRRSVLRMQARLPEGWQGVEALSWKRWFGPCSTLLFTQSGWRGGSRGGNGGRAERPHPD